MVVFPTAIALNAPAGFALGIMALRSQSQVMPSIVHMALDTMGNLVGT
jgi:membrane protease YdiL (CAAX protease family)